MEIGFSVYGRKYTYLSSWRNIPFYRLSDGGWSAQLDQYFLKRDGTLGWDMEMSVHPDLRKLPWCIYDFACLSPRGIYLAGHLAV